MQTPEFWETDAFPARLLEPFGYLYALATRRRLEKTQPVDTGVPVFCIGNLTAGGAGKTPVAGAVMAMVRDLGVEGHFLSRGYGGKLRGPVRVDPIRHEYRDVGDEPLLLASRAPCWIARDRAAGARAAVQAGAEALVMDDGHQNPALVKTLSLVVIDGTFGFGNRRILPAGPLREPIRTGLARADAIVRIGEDRADIDRWLPASVPLFTARLVPGAAAGRLAGEKVVAFAGIGRPAKFFETLREIGANVLAEHPFADHYPYAPTDIQPILDEAQALGAIPVTTTKDAMRLPASQRAGVDVVGVEVRMDDEPGFRSLIRETITTFTTTPSP